MSPEQLLEYKERLSDRNWAKIDKGKKLDYLLDRVSLLDGDDQIKLVFDLTEKFEYVDYLDLMIELQEIFESCVRQKSQQADILVLPLKAPFIKVERLKETPNGELLFSKIKSPDMIYPLLKNSLTDETLLDLVKFCDEPFPLIGKFKQGKTVMVLIDDFVGTGVTAKTHIDSYIDFLKQYNLSSSYNDFCVLVDTAMEQGIAYLSSLGIDCFSKRQQAKAISDDNNLSEGQRQVNITIMKGIEGKILCNHNPKYSLGFCQSESLVSIMNKSPNNTFPFYWEKCIGNVKPIFRRYYE